MCSMSPSLAISQSPPVSSDGLSAPDASFSDRLVAALRAQGVRQAFGVMGGALVPFHAALRQTNLPLVHCRHETGAVYAALEASLASDRPVLGFATTGPGLTNAITGVMAARQEGAHVLLVSGYTAPARHGRFGLQETHAGTMLPGLYQAGAVFDAAWALTDPEMLDTVLRQLERGWKRPQGFVAHLAIPLDVQRATVPSPSCSSLPALTPAAQVPSAQVVEALQRPTAIWLGYGARRAAAPIRRLAERLGAPVIATSRAKGIFPEDHPQYFGVAGSMGADPDLVERLRATGVRQVLVLGSRLGEFSATGAVVDTFERAIHVDLDPEVPGAAWPSLPTLPVVAELGAWVRGLLACDLHPAEITLPERPALPVLAPRALGPVRPQALMASLQRRVVDASRALVMSESGNAFCWTARHLAFREPGRYRQAGSFAPMGQVSAGAVGAALAQSEAVVSIVGDGAFLMQNEISTAVDTDAHVVWVVLNDARYGMVEQGLTALGQPTTCQRFPSVDFATLATALGARGVSVASESRLDEALDAALRHRGPTVIDVRIDTDERAPIGARVRSIETQCTSSSTSGA
jgi:acetolactate synthase-1/2/3 large subunit